MISISDRPPKNGALRFSGERSRCEKRKELFEKFLSEMLPVSPEGADADPSLSSCKVLLAMKENCLVGFSLLLYNFFFAPDFFEHFPCFF